MKPTMPQPTKCHECGTVAAEVICHICKTERPAFTALKNITERERRNAPRLNDYFRRYCEEPI